MRKRIHYAIATETYITTRAAVHNTMYTYRRIIETFGVHNKI